MDRDFFRRLSDAGRRAIAEALQGGQATRNKAETGYDPVTQADTAAERALRALIENHFPADAVWGEEYGWTREGAPRTWSIDPVDGTRALVCGLPSWSILVGVVEGGHHISGMIDLPVLDELLIAVDGRTERNGQPVAVSGCSNLSEARLSTTDPYLFSDEELGAFRRVHQAALVTRFGLDAMGYARVATGDLDLVIESGLKRHDYDALIPIVRGAGGFIGDWLGGGDFAQGRIVAASSRALYDEAVALLGFA